MVLVTVAPMCLVVLLGNVSFTVAYCEAPHCVRFFFFFIRVQYSVNLRAIYFPLLVILKVQCFRYQLQVHQAKPLVSI